MSRGFAGLAPNTFGNCGTSLGQELLGSVADSKPTSIGFAPAAPTTTYGISTSGSFITNPDCSEAGAARTGFGTDIYGGTVTNPDYWKGTGGVPPPGSY